jgi:predicted nucleic acid-binding protein
MKVLFDTNTLVAALVETHPHHPRALPWLIKAKQKDVTGLMGTHSLAEIYSTLTKLPIHPKISPSLAEKLILEDIIPNFQTVVLDQNDYLTVLHILATNNIEGGTTYDALIAHAAFKAQADKLLTFNVKHFKRVYPAIAHIVEEPS